MNEAEFLLHALMKNAGLQPVCFIECRDEGLLIGQTGESIIIAHRDGFVCTVHAKTVPWSLLPILAKQMYAEQIYECGLLLYRNFNQPEFEVVVNRRALTIREFS